MKRLFSILAFVVAMMYSVGYSQACNMLTPIIIDLNEGYIPQPCRFNGGTIEIIDIEAQPCLYMLILS